MRLNSALKKKRYMGKKIRISDESVNCYGTRILTSGIDLTRYEQNPVLLYMHERGKVVGLVKNLKVENDELIGEMEFDKASSLSEQLSKQYEFGSMKMVSANLRILETSSDKSLLREGQTRATITRCELFEVSVVDIGGNANAFVLSDKEGNRISMSDESNQSLLPLLNEITNNPIKKEGEMKKEELALMLGMPSTATEEELRAKITELKLAKADEEKLSKKLKALEAEQAELELSTITDAVETAISEKRITEKEKEHFMEMGKTMGLKSLKETLSLIRPQEKLSAQLNRKSEGMTLQRRKEGYGAYVKLSEVPSEEMDDLRDNHHAEYVRLFKQEYGVDPDNL